MPDARDTRRRDFSHRLNGMVNQRLSRSSGGRTLRNIFSSIRS
jgi:hypothetical protein